MSFSWTILSLFIALSLSARVPGYYESEEHGFPLVATPHGWRPIQCVHEWPSGTTIAKGINSTHVTLPDGTKKILPLLAECLKMDYTGPSPSSSSPSSSTSPSEGKSKVGEYINDGWLDNAEYYTISRNSNEFVHSLNGTYVIPSNPTHLGGILYYFLGTQNNDNSGALGITILQPVLSFGQMGRYAWEMASWNCCPQGQSHVSNSISGFGPGNRVGGVVKELGGAGGDWEVISSWNGQQSTLRVQDAGRTFDWIDATLETYEVALDCLKLSSGVMQFSNIHLEDRNGNSIFARNPKWVADNGGVSGCNGVLKVINPGNIQIQHN